MRVNIYAEEMTERIEIISKTIEGKGTFTGLRFYLELPVTSTVFRGKDDKPLQMKGPFIHKPGDDDSAAVTFWGKQDLRISLLLALKKLNEYYGNQIIQA